MVSVLQALNMAGSSPSVCSSMWIACQVEIAFLAIYRSPKLVLLDYTRWSIDLKDDYCHSATFSSGLISAYTCPALCLHEPNARSIYHPNRTESRGHFLKNHTVSLNQLVQRGLH